MRVPQSTKEEINTLRQLADTRGFDLTASLSDAVIKWTKQVREELGSQSSSASSTVHKTHASNGSDREQP